MSARRLTSMLVSRGKVVLARLAARTLLQITALDGETFSNIELLLPPGYVALPAAGADILALQANGVRGHIVALGGDNTADVVTDLAAGERGIAWGGAAKSVVLRTGSVTVRDPASIILWAPSLQWTPDGVNFYALATNAHVHPNVAFGSEPSPPPSTGLT